MGLSPDRIKKTAQKLKRALAEAGHPVKHMKCIEVIAAGLGFGCYAALLAAPAAPEPDDWDSDAAIARLRAIGGCDLHSCALYDLFARIL